MEQTRHIERSGNGEERTIVLAGSQELWAYAEQMLAERAHKGYFPEERGEE